MIPEPQSNLLSATDAVPISNAVTDIQPQATPLKTPFGKIALALSGGGFRAAAYSLGAMSYLHNLKYPDGAGDKRVLDNVEFVSSASGGTFTGMLYSMHVMQGKRFEDTYTTLLTFMNGQGLLEQVLKLINDDAEWTEGKSRNFINAFARAYNKQLFNKETFGVYRPKNNTTPQRLLEVCFNTTEFYRGMSFRFQAGSSAGSAGKVGNAYISFKNNDNAALETLDKVRLGDVMAASSCFPGGFEPMLFPKDFAYGGVGGGLQTEALKEALDTEDYNLRKINYDKNIGFMDGGIDDNQGLKSAMLADGRRRKKSGDEGFDLIFITDVASYFMKPYIAPGEATGGIRTGSLCSITAWCNNGIRKIKNTVSSIVIISFLLFVAGLFLLFKVPTLLPYSLVLVITTIAATIFLIILFFKIKVIGLPLINKIQHYLGLSEDETVNLIKESFPATKNFSDAVLKLLVKNLKNSPLGILEQMLKARANSLLSMAMDINLKQTRRLIFDIFYNNKTWENRRVFNVIYELSTFNSESRLQTLTEKFDRKRYRLPPGNTATDTWAKECIDALTLECGKLQQIAENARLMGTTLWFDQKDADTKKLPDVLACGQFTTCVKMLEYVMVVERVLEVQKQLPASAKTIDFDEKQLAIFKSVKQQVEADWAAFKSNPYFLVEKYSSKSESIPASGIHQ